MTTKPLAYTHEHAETAMCLWEACLDASKGSTLRELFEDARDAEGTSQVRFRILSHVAAICDATYYALKKADVDERCDFDPFDWEFCPAFLCLAWDWDKWRLKPDAHEVLTRRFRIK